MSKIKTHKGLLKRISLTKTNKVKHNKAGYKHLRSHKSPKRLMRLRQPSYMSAAEAKRLSRLLGTRLRGREQPKAAMRRSPSPAERRARREAARQAAAQD